MQTKAYVRDYMSPRLVSLEPDMEIVQGVQVLLANNVSGAPVLDSGGSLVGMLTERDCMKVVLNAIYHSEYGGVVADYMATDIEVLQADDSLIDAAKKFYEQRYLRYPVMREGRVAGIISRSDVMRAVGDFWDWKYRKD